MKLLVVDDILDWIGYIYMWQGKNDDDLDWRDVWIEFVWEGRKCWDVDVIVDEV